MPKNWKTYKLGEVADVQNGYAFKSKDLVESGIPVIKIKNIVPPNISLDGAGYFNGEIDDKLKKYIIKRGDFLISMTGSTVNVMSSAVGKMGKYRLDDLALLNQRAGKIYVTNPEKLDFEYLCHFLNRYEIHYNLALNATGSANQANISPTQIKDLELNLPPLPEQKAIAQILSAIDDKIENNLAINITLEEMAMALYKHWFVDFGPFQDGEFVDSELGEIPKGWEVKKLMDCNDLVLGGTPARKNESYWTNGTIGWLNSGKVNEFRITEPTSLITNEALKKSSTKLMKAGTTVIAITGATLGQISRIEKDFCANQSVIGILESKIFSNEFIYLWMNHSIEELIKQSTGGAQQHVNKNDVGELLIIQPELETNLLFQNEVKSFFETIKLNCLENLNLTKFRDTLLPKLVSGEIRLKEFQEKVEQKV